LPNELLYLIEQVEKSDRDSLSLEWNPQEPSFAWTNEEVSSLASFICLFYSQKPGPLLIPAESSEQFERMLFAFWSQQWPSLRRDFTFSTGSLSARRLGSRPFDVQCAPVAIIRDLQLELSRLTESVPVKTLSPVATLPTWAILAADDCLHPAGGHARAFLWKVAASDSERQDVAGFLRVYELLRLDSDLSDFLAIVAKSFPTPIHAARLKHQLFGAPGDRSFFLDVDETAMLSKIGSCENHAAYDALSLRLFERGATVSNDHASARLLIGNLFKSELNPLGVEILAGLVSVLDSQAAREITYEQPQFLSVLVRAKPELVASPILWRAVGERKWWLFESIVDDERLDSEIAQRISYALLESNSEDLVPGAIDAWSKHAVFGVLGWVSDKGGSISESCRGALRSEIQAIMDWIETRDTKSLRSI
jgi:hypothetical protein